MKIAMVSEHANPLAALGGAECGGQNLHVAELARALVALGSQVTVYTRRDNPNSPAVVHAVEGYRVVHVPAGPAVAVPRDELMPHLGEFAARLRELWRAERPDVVHAHFWMSGLTAVLAVRECRSPVVLTYHALGAVKRRHQGSVDTSPPQRIRLERLIGREVAAVIATCSDEARELVRLGVDRSVISVVPCGVDCERFTPHGPQLPRGPRYRAVVVGRLVPRKGIDCALAAVAEVSNTELMIVGGPQRHLLGGVAEARRLKDLAVRLGIDGRVHFTGQLARPQLPALLRSADVVLCVPWYEPFGIVTLEAMACAKPVLAAAVGGLLDTVVDGITGEHVPPRRPDVLASRLRALLADPVRRQSYGVAGRDRATACYRWDQVAADTLAIYYRVLDQSRTGEPVSPHVASLAAGGR